MSRFHIPTPRLQGKAPLAAAAAVLIALGAGGGAAAVSMTRPSVTMAPTVQTPIAKLASTSGVVTAKGKFVEGVALCVPVNDLKFAIENAR